jgi:predicted permease
MDPVLKDSRVRSDDRVQGGYYQFVARLMPGMTWPQANSELGSLPTWLLQQFPTENEKFKTVTFTERGSLDSQGRQTFATMMVIMFGASALVLVIASSNVASLVLMRGVARRDEVAVRKALGAGRWRILWQHVTEAVLIWLLGGIAGALAVFTLVKVGFGPALAVFGIPEIAVPFEWRVVGFAAGFALATGVLFSIAPAWKAMAVTPASNLPAPGTRATRQFSAGSVLTVVQLSASLALLVSALMLGATLRNLMLLDLGFEPENVTVFTARPPRALSDPAAHAYLAEFTERLAARPGVDAVAMASGAPFVANPSGSRIRRPGSDRYVQIESLQILSPNYFETLRIPLIRGRAFTASEIPAPGVSGVPAVILSESLARQLFGTVEIIGRTVEIPVYQQPIDVYPVVGVAADVRYAEFADGPKPLLYSPGGAPRAMLIARASQPMHLAAEIAQVAASLNTPPPNDISTLDQAIRRTRAEWDVLTWLMTSLAVIASVLAAVGVYGVVAFAAASRRAEYGIRIALGASPGMVRRHVLRGAAIMAVAGVVFGLGGGFGLMQVLRGRLVGVSPMEPAIWAIAAILLIAVVATASFIPARKASTVNLVDTLKAM